MDYDDTEIYTVQDEVIPEEENPAYSDEHRDLIKGEFWRHIPAFEDVDAEEFNDHMWQLKNSVTSVKKMLEILRGVIDESFVQDVEQGFAKAPMAVRVTPYVLSLIDWKNPYDDPLRRQFIPVSSKLTPDHPELHLDTLREQDDAPVNGLTHRYPDRALFLALDTCPVYCRYCTRSYAVGLNTDEVEKQSYSQNQKRWEPAFEYIRNHPLLEDIVISGGDAYMLRPERLKHIGETLLNMPNIRRIRFATKGLAIMPQKILTDDAWYNALQEVHELGLKKAKEVCIHTHFSHPNEITDITRQAMNRVMRDGITVRNQAVLQRGVNDSADTMILLTKRLARVNVQSYYVYMHDLVQGVEDLRTTLASGIEIDKWVRGSTAGFNTPLFVVDAPGGGGKRDIHSFEHYNQETGISVYTAPAVKPGAYFLYFDPMDLLKPDIQKAWQDEGLRTEMKKAAIEAAQHGRK